MKYIKRFFTIVSLIVVPLAFVMITQNRVDHNTLRIQGFYQEDKNSLDVVFIGSSQIYAGYSPAYAYGEFGYTSYNISVESNRVEFYKNQIYEVLSYQNPKLFVIDISEGTRVEQDNEEDKAQFLATLRKYTDSMPISANKVKIINEFVTEDKLGFYFPFILYHGQLSDFGGARSHIAQTLRGTAYLKGEVSTNHKSDYSSMKDVRDDLSTEPIIDQAEKRLDVLLDCCRSLDMEVLFVMFPHRITDEQEYTDYLKRNYIEKYIKAAGFDIINFDRMLDQLQLDPEIDFYDNEHLNAKGQIKMTDYIGNLIADNYVLTPADQSSSNIEKWEKSYHYINLFYKYYNIHENDSEVWWYEKPGLLRELDAIDN